MSYPNGRWPAKALMDIPGGRLSKSAARSYLGMRYFIGKRTGIWITPTGPNSSYRPLSVQRSFWQAHLNGTMPQAVARPGTSNHGIAIACDLRDPIMWAKVREHGADFGWGIAGNRLGSDAPSEDWHMVLRSGKLNAKARYWYLRYRAAKRR